MTDDNDAPAGPAEDAGGLPEPESERAPAPVLRTCLNCGTPVEFAYCPKCGQHPEFPKKPWPVKSIALGIAQAFVLVSAGT